MLALVRKPGKLPYEKVGVSYDLEYGTATLELVENLVAPARVLLIDDVLATGGTARAACELIEKLGGKIVQCNFLMELKSLYGRKKLSDYPIFSLLHF